jgi:signal transduction histidine kinase
MTPPRRRWDPRGRSVRVRTTLAATVVVGLALTVAAGVLVATLQRALERSGDDAARTRARDIAALAATGALPRVLAPAGEDTFAQVVDASGTVVAATAPDLDRPPVASFVPRGDDPVVRTVTGVPDDDDPEDYRVWGLSAESPRGVRSVYVATSLESAAEATEVLRGLLLLGVPPVLLVVAFTTWVMIGRALRPVEAIRAEVADISGQAMDRRVPVPDSGDEVESLARTMNAMLARLESAARRQRVFVDDASHELQTPLASFRGRLEVALSRPEATDWPAVASDVLDDSVRMERLVRDLLFLAREDDAPRPSATAPVDLDDIVLEEAARLRALAEPEVDSGRVSAAPVRGHREGLTRMVRNLLENAAAHARTRVAVELTAADGWASLVVADDGAGVAPEQRERIFDRFVRADDARSREHGGTGLGLAIVAAVVEQHRGRVCVEDAAGGGARFVVRLPLLPAQEDGATS